MKRSPRANIADLVRETGFSPGTISRAFNPESTEISVETREAILAAAEKIGYRPHTGARAIKSGQTKRWGVLLPDLDNPYYTELIECLEMEAAKRDSGLLLSLSRYDVGLLNETLLHWAAGEADGVIIDPINARQDHPTIQQLQQRRFPMVFLHDAPYPRSALIYYEMDPSFAEMANWMLDLGHKQVGYVGLDAIPAAYNNGYTGVESTLAQRGRPLRKEHVVLGPNSPEGGEAAWAYFSKLPDSPTAFICCNDAIALGLMRAAREDGKQIPGDISISGFDDTHEALHSGLTTMTGRREEMARHAFLLLEAQRRGEPGALVTQVLPTHIVKRESVGPAPRQL